MLLQFIASHLSLVSTHTHVYSCTLQCCMLQTHVQSAPVPHAEVSANLCCTRSATGQCVGRCTWVLGVACPVDITANVGNGICGFGSGIMMVLGWQAANLLQLPGTVPFEHTQVLLVAMALPTSIFLTCRSWQASSIDAPVCLAFGVCNLCSFVGGLLFLLHVLIHTPMLLKHILGWFFLAFAGLRLASDLKILPGSNNKELRRRGEHSRALMLGWAATGIVSGGISGIFGVGVSQQTSAAPVSGWHSVSLLATSHTRAVVQSNLGVASF